MSYDLEVLVEGRNKVSPLIFDKIRIEVNSHTGGRHRYKDSFSYMAEKKGAWCSIFELDKEKRFFSAMNIADINLIPESDITYPFWVNDTSGMFVLKIQDDFITSFKKTLTELQRLSPLSRIMFLPRLQGREHNNVCGVLQLDNFFYLLDNNRIFFNIAYIIQD